MDTLHELAMTLSAESVTVGDVVDRLGGQATDMTGNVIVEKPALSGVDRASVVRNLSGEAPAHVTLELARPLADDDLEAAFGPPKRVEPDHRGEPASLVFRLDLADRPYDVTLIALAQDGGARTVTLRRDVRLGAS